MGLALHQLGRLAEAQICFETALTADPSYGNARINLANTLRILGQPSAAHRELDTLLGEAVDAADVLNNLGAVLQDLGLAELALASLLRAAALQPASARIRGNLALTQLQLGDFQSGWSNLESLWEGCANLRGGYRMPANRTWHGELLAGKRVLLWSEQGFGDPLQLARFEKDVAARGATVALVVQPDLVALLRGLAGAHAVIAHGAISTSLLAWILPWCISPAPWVHGYPRATKDIDFFVWATPENAVSLMNALTQFGAPLDGVLATDFSSKGIVFQIGNSPRRNWSIPTRCT